MKAPNFVQRNKMLFFFLKHFGFFFFPLFFQPSSILEYFVISDPKSENKGGGDLERTRSQTIQLFHLQTLTPAAGFKRIQIWIHILQILADSEALVKLENILRKSRTLAGLHNMLPHKELKWCRFINKHQKLKVEAN